MGLGVGVIVLLVCGYVVLGLSERPTAPGPAVQASEDWRGAMRRSWSARLLARGGRTLTTWVDPPPWIRGWVERVNREIDDHQPS